MITTKFEKSYADLRERVLTCLETLFTVMIDATGDAALSHHRNDIFDAVKTGAHRGGWRTTLTHASSKLGEPVRSDQAERAKAKAEKSAQFRADRQMQESKEPALEGVAAVAGIEALLRATAMDPDDAIQLTIKGLGPLSVVRNFAEIRTDFDLQTIQPLIEDGIKASAKLAALALKKVEEAVNAGDRAARYYYIDAETRERLEMLYDSGVAELGLAPVVKPAVGVPTRTAGVRPLTAGVRDFVALDVGIRELVPFYLQTFNVPSLQTLAATLHNLPRIDRNADLQAVHALLEVVSVELKDHAAERHPAYAPVALANAALHLQGLNPNAKFASFETPRRTMQNAFEILVDEAVRRAEVLLITHGDRATRRTVLSRDILTPLKQAGYSITPRTVETDPDSSAPQKKGMAGIYKGVTIALHELLPAYLYAVRDTLSADPESSARNDVLDFRTDLLNLEPVTDPTGLVPAHALLTTMAENLDRVDQTRFTPTFKQLKRNIMAGRDACAYAWCAAQGLKPTALRLALPMPEMDAKLQLMSGQYHDGVQWRKYDKQHPTKDELKADEERKADEELKAKIKAETQRRRKQRSVHGIMCVPGKNYRESALDALNALASDVTGTLNALPESTPERKALQNSLRSALRLLQNAGVEISTRPRPNRRIKPTNE